MGREQLDRTKRFTDDGKLRGIISSAKFVPECISESGDIGFGQQLFKVRGEKDEQVERELDVIDDERVIKRRRITEKPEDKDSGTKVLDLLRGEKSLSKISLDGMNKRKRSKIVVLKIPKQSEESSMENTSSRKRRRVQFVDV